MIEFELKLEVPANRLRSVAAAMNEGKAIQQRFYAYYFDTEEGLLASHGITVRVRKEGARWVQTAKGTLGGSASLLERLEHNVDIPAPIAGGIPSVHLARHFGTPVGNSIQQALKLKAGDMHPALVLMYETDFQRLKRRVKLAGSVIEIALDQGHVISGSNSLALCELEVELKQGKPEHAVQLAHIWCEKHGLWLSSITKSMKGQQLRNGKSFGLAMSAVSPKYDRNANGQQIFITILQSCLSQVLANASEVAAGSIDPEHVHQLRVGIRRLRIAIREFKTLLDGADSIGVAPLIDAFRDLGKYRDIDLLIQSVQPQIKAAGGPDVDIHPANTDVSNLSAVVRSPAFQDALLSLIGFVYVEEFDMAMQEKQHSHAAMESKVIRSSVMKNKAVTKLICARLNKLHSQIIKNGRKFLVLDEAQQHDMRKRVKRLRYLSEFSAPLFSARKANSFLTSLKPVQDALGTYHDEIMALQSYHNLANQDTAAWFGVGWLSARRIPNAEICLREFKVFAKTKPFFINTNQLVN
jgi:triphosphatase